MLLGLDPDWNAQSPGRLSGVDQIQQPSGAEIRVPLEATFKTLRFLQPKIP